jgi:hypothetical protein
VVSGVSKRFEPSVPEPITILLDAVVDDPV